MTSRRTGGHRRRRRRRLARQHGKCRIGVTMVVTCELHAYRVRVDAIRHDVTVHGRDGLGGRIGIIISDRKKEKKTEKAKL